jgi:hypothetical protein
MTQRVIFVNGPPRSGKDHAGMQLMWRDDLKDATLQKFAKELKERTHALYKLLDPNGKPKVHYAYEGVKDDPLQQFHGLTPRQAYISVSENWMKPTHGAGILGTWLIENMQYCRDDAVHIITDSGFAEEAQTVVDHYGAENCFLVRVHRKGYDFSNDSRSYIDLDVKTHDIINDGTDRFTELLTQLQF